jgi:HPt (histidine-containing phosphotransfer) domain-containing protein
MVDQPEPAPSADPPPSPIGFDIEGVLERFGGDRELLQEMVGIFFDDSPAVIDLLSDGLAQHDSATVERAAHSLRGMIAYFDPAEVIETARQIEQAGRQRDLEPVPSLMRRLAQQVELLKNALQPYR